MASITIRNLDERTKERLRRRAASNRRSMEEEARQILRAAVAQRAEPGVDLVTRIQRRFRPAGGVDLPLPAREPIRPPPEPKR